ETTRRRGSPASHYQDLGELSGHRRDPRGPTAADRGYPTPVSNQAAVLVVLWAGHRDAVVSGLVTRRRRRVAAGTCTATRRTESDPQPSAQGDLQRGGDDGSDATSRRSAVPGQPTTVGRRDQAQSGKVDAGAENRRHCSCSMEGPGGIRAGET